MIEQQIEYTSKALEEAVFDFVDLLHGENRFKVEWFERMYGLTQELMKLLKEQEKVSKSLLALLYSVPQMLRDPAGYMKEHKAQLEEMAQKMEWCFSLILIGETLEDRIPGVPRII